MNFKEELKSCKGKIDILLNEYLLVEKKRAKLVSSTNERIFDFIIDFCARGGKRIRPILLTKGYEAVGGKNISEILRASISIELVEAYLLIHDDIIDEDSIRRGGPSFHRMAGEWKNEHFGISSAIIAGDMLRGLATRVIMGTSFSDELKMQAVHELIEAELECFHGELYDVVLEDEDEVKEKDFLKMVDLKTVSYTTVAPLIMGAILGEGSREQLETLRKYGKLLGRAFQLIDDILGTFGNEEKLGKPVGSDIRQGKKTLLLLYAMNNSQESEFLQDCLGNKDLKHDDLQKVKKIFKECGSLEYSKKKAFEYAKEAKSIIDSAEFEKSSKLFLTQIANFVIDRKF